MRRMRRTKARHFGDKPHRIRSNTKSGRSSDYRRINIKQRWERQHAGIKKKSTRVRPHMMYSPRAGRRVRRRGYLRKLN